MTVSREVRERLATLAAAATPGPWNSAPLTTHDARFIAAVSPDVVSGLLADLEAAETALEAAERQQGPLLGLATTEQLLHELLVRFEVPCPSPALQNRVEMILSEATEAELNYSTVRADGDGAL